MKYLLGVIFIVILVLGIFCIKKTEVLNTEYKIAVLSMGGHIFEAEVADSYSLQDLGLSGREYISEDKAMIFVFPMSGVYKFWMKDMKFPIDIIWLSPEPSDTTSLENNLQSKIIYIEKNVSPNTYPKTFGSNVSSKYVVEVASGTVDRLDLDVGDSVSFYIQ